MQWLPVIEVNENIHSIMEYSTSTMHTLLFAVFTLHLRACYFKINTNKQGLTKLPDFLKNL